MSLPQDGIPVTEDQLSILSVKSVTPLPDTISKLVKRLKALTLQLLPLEVDISKLQEPTSTVITPQVIAAYQAAAGDFREALPYALLRARSDFLWDANHDAADFDENMGRATACEVLARRIVHLMPQERLAAVMSTRYRFREADGDESAMSSALELAIDSGCTIFLSSSEAQNVILALWSGELVQTNNDHHDIDWESYATIKKSHFLGLDPTRIAVPRYQNLFRITVWLVFLLTYSQAVRQPVIQKHNDNWSMDEWEIVMYVIALSVTIEDTHKIYKLLRFVTWRAFTFWNLVSFFTDGLLFAGFVTRIVGLRQTGDAALNSRVMSFQILSFVAPLLWMKILTVFDGYKYIGTMQICVARMLRESGIFFALLSVLAVGFLQSLYALDYADGKREPGYSVVHVLIQALLGSPDFGAFEFSTQGIIIYYFWNVVTALILLNVLISLFSSAYSDIVDDAEAQFLAYFAGKTVSMIRAPDVYVYPAPFNLIETFLVAPLDMIPGLRMSPENYAKLNRIVMRIVFCVPLAIIALYESAIDGKSKNGWMTSWLGGSDDDGLDLLSDDNARDPKVDDEGLQISKVPFTELIKVFPNISQTSEAIILQEVQELKTKLDLLLKHLDVANGSSSKDVKEEST